MAIGVGAEGIELDAGALAAAVLGVGVAAALFWTYFDGAPELVERPLDQTPAGRARNVMARDAYSFLHLPMVAGIVLLALGVKKTLGDVDHELKLIAAVALCGGVALYLLADVGFRRRTLARREGPRLVAAAALLVAIPLATAVPALAALAVVAALTSALVVVEVLSPAAAGSTA